MTDRPLPAQTDSDCKGLVKPLCKMRALHVPRRHFCKGTQRRPTCEKSHCIIDRREGSNHGYREAV